MYTFNPLLPFVSENREFLKFGMKICCETTDFLVLAFTSTRFNRGVSLGACSRDISREAISSMLLECAGKNLMT